MKTYRAMGLDLIPLPSDSVSPKRVAPSSKSGTPGAGWSAPGREAFMAVAYWVVGTCGVSGAGVAGLPGSVVPSEAGSCGALVGRF